MKAKTNTTLNELLQAALLQQHDKKINLLCRQDELEKWDATGTFEFQWNEFSIAFCDLKISILRALM